MKIDIAKAWKDPSYLSSLTPEQRAQIPANPAGEVELSDGDLEAISGGLLAGTTGSSPSECSCTVTKTGTGSNCGCTCSDTPKSA